MPEVKLDSAELAKLVAAGVAEAMKPYAEQLGKLGQPAAAAAAADPAKAADAGPKPLTMDDLVKTLDQREQARAGTDARNGYVRDRLKDLPAVYANQLGTDPAKFAENEQAIRTSYRDDLKARGFKAPDVGGDASGDGTPQGGDSPANGVNLKDVPANQLIAIGLGKSDKGRSSTFTVSAAGVCGIATPAPRGGVGVGTGTGGGGGGFAG